MILKGSQRGNAAKLAAHLMNARDNEHVELHELRGFMSEEDLHGALKEAEAIAKGTRCQQHLFSLSLNPPQNAYVDTAVDCHRELMGWIPPPDGIAMCQGDVGHITDRRKHPWNKLPSLG